MVHFLVSFHSRHRLVVAMLLSAAGAACASGPEGDECLAELTAPCAPTINTDFSSIHRSLFAPRCGTTGNACHGPDGRKGDLVLADEETAYRALLGMDGTSARVYPQDAACSPLLQRLESADPGKRMPLGDDILHEGLRCAVRTWIETGAAR